MQEFLCQSAASGGPIIVLDLEMTAWEGSLAAKWSRPGEYKEIVQIGAVRLAPDLSEVGDFSRYVRPVRNPVLSSYLTDLTGITQHMIDTLGSDFPSALCDFADFVDNASVIVSNGPDGDVVIENCHLNGIVCPINASRFRDIRKDVGNALTIGDAGAFSFMLPTLIGGQSPGRAHDALSDARCIAATLRFIATKS
jgi:inhibitor of KinA sporulation pathway (predicted exonuclease)